MAEGKLCPRIGVAEVRLLALKLHRLHTALRLQERLHLPVSAWFTSLLSSLPQNGSGFSTLPPQSLMRLLKALTMRLISSWFVW
jgi:hypothetical protein